MWAFPFFSARSETVVERMLSNWMSICLYQFLKVTANTIHSSILPMSSYYPKTWMAFVLHLWNEGFCWRATVQAVQRAETPSREGTSWCRTEKGQIHSKRHRTLGRGCRISCTCKCHNWLINIYLLLFYLEKMPLFLHLFYSEFSVLQWILVPWNSKINKC